MAENPRPDGSLPTRLPDRSLSDELVANYLRTAVAGRAWFLESDGFGLAQRWHAKCVAESDFAAVQGKGKRRPGTGNSGVSTPFWESCNQAATL